jgi:hypothetical protein
MKRSPFRSSGAPLKRTTPLARTSGLAQRSAKMRARYAGEGGRAELVGRLLAERPACEAGIAGVCAGRSVHVHEVLPRSAGGSILDVANLRAVCAPCHAHIHSHPRESRAAGLLGSRYATEHR